MFTVARDCFAAHYGLADPNAIAVPEYLDRSDFGLVLALSLGLGLLAGWFPARQASRVDPVEVLREA